MLFCSVFFPSDNSLLVREVKEENDLLGKQIEFEFEVEDIDDEGKLCYGSQLYEGTVVSPCLGKFCVVKLTWKYVNPRFLTASTDVCLVYISVYQCIHNRARTVHSLCLICCHHIIDYL